MRRRDCKALEPDRSARLTVPTLLLASGATLAALCGCSGPILTFGAKPEAGRAERERPEPTSTGSIAKRPASFGADLGEEDWRRARAALSVALDPQGNGRPVKWENPDSAMRGSVNPTGLPYVADDEICRDFLASVVSPKASRFLRGTGCKASGGTWELRRLRSARAGSGA